VQDADGFKLAVNIQTDLGAGFDGYTYETNNSPTETADYGVGMSNLGLDEKTIFKLTCTDTSAGTIHSMYVAGLSGGGINAFSAAGREITDNGSSIVCSNSADLSSPLFGSNCFVYDNAQHTYWGGTALDITWALYSSGAPYALRHCVAGYTGLHNTGAIWYKKSTAPLPIGAEQ